MAKSHIVSPSRVWIVEGKRTDTGNSLYYRVWAGSHDGAKAYLKREELHGIGVEFTSVRELSLGRYEMTINCKINHPDRYEG